MVVVVRIEKIRIVLNELLSWYQRRARIKRQLLTLPPYYYHHHHHPLRRNRYYYKIALQRASRMVNYYEKLIADMKWKLHPPRLTDLLGALATRQK